MTTPLRAQHTQTPATRGVHHLALNTDDMKATVDFYTRVMGMPLVHALRVPPGVGVGPGNRGNPPFENLRHYFFDAGGDTLVAFFEMPKGAKGLGDRDALAAMQHCSFTTSKSQFDVLHQRLKDEGVALISRWIAEWPGSRGCDQETSNSARHSASASRLSRSQG